MIKLLPLTPTVGAEIEGIDLRQKLSADSAKELHAAWTEFKVLFFRDQEISLRHQLALAEQFGGISAQGTYGVFRKDTSNSKVLSDNDSMPGVQQVLHDRTRTKGLDNVWHSDSMFWAEPPRGAILRSVEIPTIGGDTVFADMNAAFEGLSREMQAFLLPLSAVNDVSISARQSVAPEVVPELQRQFPPVVHPLIRTHPVSGKKAIYASAPNTSHIVGLAPEESREILQFLFRQATILEYQCRFRWSNGCVAIWDNRVLQHYAVYDYWPHHRIMERVLLAGEKPV